MKTEPARLAIRTPIFKSVIVMEICTALGIVEVEPLKSELNNFVQCILEDTMPKTDGYNGLDVVRVIEAANVSLHESLGDVELVPLTRTGNQVELTEAT